VVRSDIAHVTQLDSDATGLAAERAAVVGVQREADVRADAIGHGPDGQAVGAQVPGELRRVKDLIDPPSGPGLGASAGGGRGGRPSGPDPATRLLQDLDP
jgi:hypothetical protein